MFKAFFRLSFTSLFPTLFPGRMGEGWLLYLQVIKRKVRTPEGSMPRKEKGRREEENKRVGVWYVSSARRKVSQRIDSQLAGLARLVWKW